MKRPPCRALLKNGDRCRTFARDSGFCYFHEHNGSPHGTVDGSGPSGAPLVAEAFASDADYQAGVRAALAFYEARKRHDLVYMLTSILGMVDMFLIADAELRGEVMTAPELDLTRRFVAADLHAGDELLERALERLREGATRPSTETVH